jgi:hypothetical protein
MHDRGKKLLIFALIAILNLTNLGLQAGAQGHQPAESATVEHMILDFILLRPLGTAATVLGAVFFTASLPFSTIGGNTKAAFQKLVIEPAKFTFKRPLGEGEEEGVPGY